MTQEIVRTGLAFVVALVTATATFFTLVGRVDRKATSNTERIEALETYSVQKEDFARIDERVKRIEFDVKEIKMANETQALKMNTVETKLTVLDERLKNIQGLLESAASLRADQ